MAQDNSNQPRNSQLEIFNEIPELSEAMRKQAMELQKQMLAKRKSKRSVSEEAPTLTLNSLMDIFTNILVYLIMTYSSTPVSINQSNDLQLPQTISQLAPPEAVPLVVARSGILVNNAAVAPLTDWKVPDGLKDGQFKITPVVEKLREEADNEKRMAELNPNKQFEGLILLIADKEMPASLLFEVMYSAGQAEYGKFKYTCVKKS